MSTTVRTLLTIDERATNRQASRGTDPPRHRRAGGRLTMAAPQTVGAAPRIAERPDRSAILPAAARQLGQLPAFVPLLEEVEVAGWSSHRRTLSGNFHDWLLLGEGQLLVAVGQAVGPGITDAAESALVTQATWAAIRAHAHHTRDAGTLLSLATQSLWPAPHVELHTAVAVALVDIAEGQVSVAMAGDCLAWRVRAATTEQLVAHQPPLGEVADFTYLSQSARLTLRERLLLVADDPLQRSPKLPASIAASFAQLDVESHRRMLAADAVALVREHYEPRLDRDSSAPASIVAVRRR